MFIMKDDMTPMNVGAPQLIPAGNVNSDSPGSFGAMQREYYKNSTSSSVFKTRCGTYPNFVPTYGSLPGEWQTMTNSTKNKN